MDIGRAAANLYGLRPKKVYTSRPPMSMEPWAVTKKGLHKCGSDTSSCPGPYPTAACPKFQVGYRLGQ